MSESVLKPEQVFTLDILAPFLPGFRAPEEPHDPAGDWRLEYGLYSLGAVRGIGRRVGDVVLSRKQQGPDAFTLSVECRRPVGPGFLTRLAAEIEAQAEPLPLPTRWSWESEIRDPSSAVMPESRLRRAAELRDGEVRIGGKPACRIAGPCTVNWLLFEAVGRLPHGKSDLPEFTLLDDFDRPKPGQTLRYGQQLTVLLGERRAPQTRIEELPKGRIHKSFWGAVGGRPLELHVWQHVGRGIVPFLYWVDQQGRLLFAVSGLEAYVLESFAEKSQQRIEP